MEDLKEYILTAFSKLKNTNQFYDILDSEAKNFGKVPVPTIHLLSSLEEVLE